PETRLSTSSPDTVNPSMFSPCLPYASASFTSSPCRSSPRTIARSFATCIAESSPRCAGRAARAEDNAPQLTLARDGSRVTSFARGSHDQRSPELPAAARDPRVWAPGDEHDAWPHRELDGLAHPRALRARSLS